MKRSQVNAALVWAKSVLEENQLRLPDYAYWPMTEWRANADQLSRIKAVMQGWDITDYGSGDFEKLGSILYTVRNGTDDLQGTPYAEKLIVLYDGQRLPMHCHRTKTEDIINRGGGILAIKLYNSKADGDVDYDTDVEVYMDGIKKIVRPGQTLEISKGNSVTLTRGMYHLFWAKEGAGNLIVGEVSSINDDRVDNYFAEPVSRFSEIEEDEPILHPLCNEYDLVL
jgi:D-lyxose ketol-isomerase